MKLNLLATSAVAALVVSGGAWAQAQAPGQKQDEKAQMHDQKGAGAAKQNRGEDKQAGKDRSDAAKGQHAQDAQQKGNAGREQANAKKDDASNKKDDASKSAEQAQSKHPNAAAENQKNEPRANERDRHSHDDQPVHCSLPPRTSADCGLAPRRVEQDSCPLGRA